VDEEDTAEGVIAELVDRVLGMPLILPDGLRPSDLDEMFAFEDPSAAWSRATKRAISVLPVPGPSSKRRCWAALSALSRVLPAPAAR
jgi:hypothetical protein